MVGGAIGVGIGIDSQLLLVIAGVEASDGSRALHVGPVMTVNDGASSLARVPFLGEAAGQSGLVVLLRLGRE